MKKFKMALIAVALVGLVLGVQSQGWALNYSVEMDAVSFLVVNDSDDGVGSINLTLEDLAIPSGSTLQYRVGSAGDFSNFVISEDSIFVPLGEALGSYETVFLQIVTNEGEDNEAIDKGGSVRFNSFSYNKYSLDLYNSLFVDFGSGEFEVFADTPSDKLSPSQVPIPPAALLLGVGMLGMVSFRKRGGRK